MSGIDQAFIKAFRKDPAGHDSAKPHVTFHVQNTATPSVANASATDAVPETLASPELGVNASEPAATLPSEPSPEYSQSRPAAIDSPHAAVQGPHWSQTNAAQTHSTANETALPAWARPAYEVERFAWPEVCRQLVSTEGRQLDGTVKVLLDQSRTGKQVVYVTGTGRGEGCTTVLLCLAQRLAAIGVKCALVDANFDAPGLVQSLGVSPVAGWEDVAREQQGVAEVMIQSAEDHLAVLPLRSPLADARVLANDLHWSVTLATLKQHYQIVLIDGPSTVSPSSSAITSLGAHIGIDMAILVSVDADAALHELADATNQLTSAGVEVLGVIENVCQPLSVSTLENSFTSQIA